MNHPATAREALIVEAIGEVANLIQVVEALAPILTESCRALQQASAGLRDELAGFERRIAAIAENVKSQAVKHIAARAEEVAGRSIDRQSRAMADAARVAFGAELGATMQRLQTTFAVAAGATRTALGSMADPHRRRRGWGDGHVGIRPVRWTALTQATIAAMSSRAQALRFRFGSVGLRASAGSSRFDNRNLVFGHRCSVMTTS